MKRLALFFLLLSLCCPSLCAAQSGTEKIIRRVNNHWQQLHPRPGRAFWDEAVYHTGNMEAARLLGNDKWLAYSEAWAEHNAWKGAASDDRSAWKHGYGETDDYVLFGDWQICFQTYADLYALKPAPEKIARAREVMEYEMGTARRDYWWWADGLYMVMPVMSRLYKITENPLYLEKLHDYFTYADSLMYDTEAHLYYRDGRYVYPKHKSSNGGRDFWSRGDGWVFAALARTLADLPLEAPHRSLYVSRFISMAEALAACQQTEGYWTRSLLDPSYAPGPETSGTALFTYGFLWGVNNGYLDKNLYRPTIDRAWAYLTTVALQEDGSIGYVQPIGDRAIPGQVVDRESTANFGVGAFLLAACEKERYDEADLRWKLIWSDEFDGNGAVDTARWSFEHGLARNEEHQYYTDRNASRENGLLVIESRRERTDNPNYKKGSSLWNESRRRADYTSSSINTRGKFDFLYGRLEVRAKIPTASGAWPAIWLLGQGVDWPSCGEIDLMEYYRIDQVPHILANAAWGGEVPNVAIWNSARIPFTCFTDRDPAWADKFHVWRLDWDERSMRFFLDDELLNEIPMSQMINGSLGGHTNPFTKPQYILLNLAIGGIHGGQPDPKAFPMRYEVDYVRVYQK